MFRHRFNAEKIVRSNNTIETAIYPFFFLSGPGFIVEPHIVFDVSIPYGNTYYIRVRREGRSNISPASLKDIQYHSPCKTAVSSALKCPGDSLLPLEVGSFLSKNRSQ
jgi:hypothetical protein